MRTLAMAVVILFASNARAQLTADLSQQVASCESELLMQRARAKIIAGTVLLPLGGAETFAGVLLTAVGSFRLFGSPIDVPMVASGLVLLAVGAASVITGSALHSSGKADQRRARMIAIDPAAMAVRF